MDARALEQIEANLKVLAQVDLELARRIIAPIDDHVLDASDLDAPIYIHRRARFALRTTDDVRAELVDGLEANHPVLIVGAGDVPLIEAVLARAGEQKVVVWDRDPCLLRLLLASRDWGEALESHRLLPCLGADLLLLREHRDALALVLHPLLARLYASELEVWRHGPGEAPVAVWTGGLFVDDMEAALRAQGHVVYPLELRRLSRGEIDLTLRTLKPSLVMGINYIRGVETLAFEHDCEVATWEIDPTIDRPLPPMGETSRFHFFTFREAQRDWFREVGFQHSMYLPLATSAARRTPIALSAEDREAYGAPVSFVGSSMADQAAVFRNSFLTAYMAWRGTDAAIGQGERLLDGLLEMQRSDLFNYMLPQLMKDHLGEFMAEMIARDPRVDTTMWPGEIAASEKRLTLVARMGAMGARVWGDPGWERITEFGVRYMGRANHGEELSKIYCASDINVDIGRIYQQDIVTMRVFDVLGCGGFLLAEYSEALEDLFELDIELVTWRTWEDLRDKVTYYLAHPEERRALAEAGRRAVLERHMIEQRIETILEHLSPDLHSV